MVNVLTKGYEKKLVPITEEYLDRLEKEIKRTDIKPTRALELRGIASPSALSVTKWRKRRITKTRPENLELVEQTYASLPSKELQITLRLFEIDFINLETKHLLSRNTN